MEQPTWNQRDGVVCGGNAMGGESCHADLDHQASMADLRCEVHGALLMELMDDDDLPSSGSDVLLLDDGDVDRLSHVIRSLEAEISGGDEGTAVMMAAGEDAEILNTRIIEDVLSSGDGIIMDGYEGLIGSSVSGYWPQAAVSSSSSLLAAGHEAAEGWCVYEYDCTSDGYEYEGGINFVGYDDTVDHHQQYNYCCAEGSVEHMMYPSPLWE